MHGSMAFKVGYAHGLRRHELIVLIVLDVHDFGPSPHAQDDGRFGALTVRCAFEERPEPGPAGAQC